MTDLPTTMPPSASYLNATGAIPYGMTNDYMFRAVLQKNNDVLKGLICSLLHLAPDDVASVVITNPIELGDAADDKEFILDVSLLLNDSTAVNLEMQMAWQMDWQERSLSYLCRSFDQLSRGAGYGQAMRTIHIGFLNFAPDREAEPEFYARYRILNEKTGRPYSDKFLLRVVNLKQISSATEEDRANGIDYWARLFTATSWEEIKMIAQDNRFLSAASQAMYESNADEITRQKCLAREDYYRRERFLKEATERVSLLEQQLAEQKDALAEKETALVEKETALAEKETVLAETKNVLVEKDRQIAELEQLLAEAGRK